MKNKVSNAWRGFAVIGVWTAAFLGVRETKDSATFILALVATLFICGC